MPDKKITELTELTIPAYEDLFATVDDPSGSPVTMKITLLNLLGGPKPTSPSDYDDEFDSGALDAKWTAINCATGTVGLLSTAAAADTWDATMFAGMMALQPGRDDDGAGGHEAEAAILRQTVALATNCKFVSKVDMAITSDGLGTISNAGIGILLSGANGFNDDNYIFVSMRPFYTGAAPMTGVLGSGSCNIGGAGASTLIGPAGMPMPKCVMITKTGNNYSAFLGTGASWGGLADSAAPDNTVFVFGAGVMVRLSVFAYWAPPAAEVNLFNPITTLDFVRYFENNTPLVYK